MVLVLPLLPLRPVEVLPLPLMEELVVLPKLVPFDDPATELLAEVVPP